MNISSLSTEYIKVPVTATVSGVAINPTTDTVQFAFTAADVNPVLADWKSGTWETSGGVYYARCLVGPAGTVTLAAGDYWVWLKVTDNPEVPVRAVGALRVT